MAARVLIADGRVVARHGLVSLFAARTDFVICAEAENGREAVDLAIKYKPDVALIDVSLPILNGIETTRQIRGASPLTAVLMLSDEDDEQPINEALAAGARAYLLKTEAHERIVRTVELLARKRPLRLVS